MPHNIRKLTNQELLQAYANLAYATDELWILGVMNEVMFRLGDWFDAPKPSCVINHKEL